MAVDALAPDVTDSESSSAMILTVKDVFVSRINPMIHQSAMFKFPGMIIKWKCILILPHNKLEQLECLCSEDIPCHLMITHTIESYWNLSQNKTKSVTNFKNFSKLKVFEFWKNLNTKHTFWNCLIRCVNMKWIRWLLRKIQSGQDSVHRRTDGQTDTQEKKKTDTRTDRETDKVKPLYPPSNSLSEGYNNSLCKGLTHNFPCSILSYLVHWKMGWFLVAWWAIYMRECELGHHDINLDNDEVCSLKKLIYHKLL